MNQRCPWCEQSLSYPVLTAPEPVIRRLIKALPWKFTSRCLYDAVDRCGLTLPEGSRATFVRLLENDGLITRTYRGRGRAPSRFERLR